MPMLYAARFAVKKEKLERQTGLACIWLCQIHVVLSRFARSDVQPGGAPLARRLNG
jgi:hypothetical protein